MAEGSQTNSGGGVFNPYNDILYRGQLHPWTHRPSPFVEQPAPNLAAVVPPPGHGFTSHGSQLPSGENHLTIQGPQFHKTEHQFSSQKPAEESRGKPNTVAGVHSPGGVKTPTTGYQFPIAGSQFPSVGPIGSQVPHTAVAPPHRPAPFTASAAAAAAAAAAAVAATQSSHHTNPSGVTLPGFGTKRQQVRSSLPPSPLEAQPVRPLEAPASPPSGPQYAGIDGRTLPVAATTSRQRRANWQPGHPFQGVTLEGTYLDPQRRQETAEEPGLHQRKTAVGRDRARSAQTETTGRFGQVGRRKRPQETQRDYYSRPERHQQRDRYNKPVEELQRDRYNTLHRESYSRQRVEPITDSAEFFSQEERDGDGGGDGDGGDGHHHAMRENHGYPRDHAARHVYGDGHRAGDPYNIRPTDEQVERGYARDEARGHFYSRQRFDDVDDFSGEEEDRTRRRRPGRRARRPLRQRYTGRESADDRREYPRYAAEGDGSQSGRRYNGDGERQRRRRPAIRSEDVAVDVREDRRGGRNRKTTRQQTAEHDDYSDYPADYPSDDSDDYPADYPADYQADYPADYADDDDYPADYTDSEEARAPALEDYEDFRPERRPISRGRPLKRPVIAAADSGEYPESETSRVAKRRSVSGREVARDQYASESHRPSSGENDGEKADVKQRQTYQGYRGDGRTGGASSDWNGGASSDDDGRLKLRSVEGTGRGRSAGSERMVGGSFEKDSQPGEARFHRRHRRSISARDLKDLGGDTSPDHLILERTMAVVRSRRDVQQKPVERSESVGSLAYSGSSPRPADFTQVSKAGENSVPSDIKQQQREKEAEGGRPEDDRRVEESSESPEGDQPESDFNGSHQEKGNDAVDSDGLSESNISAEPRHRVTDPVSFSTPQTSARLAHQTSGRPADQTSSLRRPQVSVSDDYRPPRWWESTRRDPFTQSFPSSVRGLNSVTNPDSRRYQGKRNPPSGRHAVSETYFSSKFPKRTSTMRPRFYTSNRARQLGFERTLERRQRHAAPSIGDEQPNMMTSDAPGSFAEIEPVQTNSLHSQHSKLSGRQRLQQLIGSSDDVTEPGDYDVRGPGGYRDHESLGSRRPGGVPGDHHSNDLRYYDDKLHGVGDNRRRPTEDQQRPPGPGSYDERDRPSERPSSDGPGPSSEGPRYDLAEDDLRRYPENGRDKYSDNQEQGDDRGPHGNRNYYIITPNELASDDVTSYEKPSRPSGGRRRDRYRRPLPQQYQDYQEQEEGRYQDRPEQEDEKYQDYPAQEDGRYQDRPEQEDGRYKDRTEQNAERYQDRGQGDDQRRNPAYDRQPSDGERGDGGRRYYFFRRPQDDGRRYPDDERRYSEDERRYPEDERQYSEDERRRPDDERRYPEDERHHPDEERRHPNGIRRHPDDEERYAEDEKRYSSNDNVKDGYQDDERRPSEASGYHGDQRKPSEDNGYHDDQRRPSEGNGYQGDERRPSEDNGYHGDQRRPSEDSGYQGDEKDSGGRRHLHEEPEERPQFYREPNSRYPNSAEDNGEGGYYRMPHPEEVEQERLYRRPQDTGERTE